MKPIKLLIALAFGGVIFASCSKNNSGSLNAVPQNNIKKNESAYAPGATTQARAIVSYSLTTLFPAPSADIQWNSGYISTGDIFFNGTHIIGNMLSLTKFSTQTNQTIQLSASSALGSVAVEPDKFDYASFSVNLHQSNSMHALFLDGTYTANGQQTPVQLIADNELELTSMGVVPPALTIQKYTAALFLSIEEIVKGINGNNLSNTVKTNGVIIISAASNTGLYQLVLYNLNSLQGQIPVKFEALPVGSTNFTTAPDPVK